MLACDKEAIVEATASCMRRPLPVKCKEYVFKSSTTSESRDFPIMLPAFPRLPESFWASLTGTKTPYFLNKQIHFFCFTLCLFLPIHKMAGIDGVHTSWCSFLLLLFFSLFFIMLW